MILHSILLASLLITAQIQPVPDTPFTQEFHEPYPLPTAAANDVRTVFVDKIDTIWAGTAVGLFRLDEGTWIKQSDLDEGPVYELFADKSGTLWAGAWDGIYQILGD